MNQGEEKPYMDRLNNHCFKCGSPVVETLTESVKPFLRMNIVRYSCGAVFMGAGEVNSTSQRFFHSGCGDRNIRSAIQP